MECHPKGDCRVICDMRPKLQGKPESLLDSQYSKIRRRQSVINARLLKGGERHSHTFAW